MNLQETSSYTRNSTRASERHSLISRGDMKLRTLIGTLVAMLLVASCATEPEEVVPTTVAEDVARIAIPGPVGESIVTVGGLV